MSLTYNPVGLAPQGYSGYGPYEGGAVTYQLTTNNTVALGRGDVVGLVGGSVVALTADPVLTAAPGNSTALTSSFILGVVTGFSYYVPAGQLVPFQNVQVLPANAVNNGYTAIFVTVALANPGTLFSVQANGVITSAQVGGTISLAGYGTADTQYRKSSLMYANASTISQSAASTQAWKVVAIDHRLDNAQTFGASISTIPNDLYTQILVQAIPAATIFGAQGGQ